MHKINLRLLRRFLVLAAPYWFAADKKRGRWLLFLLVLLLIGLLSACANEMAPNGIALSPDERTLYVNQSDPKSPVIKAFPVRDDGTLGEGALYEAMNIASRWAIRLLIVLENNR